MVWGLLGKIGSTLLKKRKLVKAVVTNTAFTTTANEAGKQIGWAVSLEVIKEFLGEQPLADGTIPDEIKRKEAGYADREKGVQSLKTLVEEQKLHTDSSLPEIYSLPKYIFPNEFVDPFSSLKPKSNVPQPPKRLLASKSKKYTSQVTQSLATRKYGSLLAHIYDTNKMYYMTAFNTIGDVSAFYDEWIKANQNYAAKVITPEGRFKHGIESNSIVKLRLPISEKSILVVGDDNLMALCDFYESRNAEIENFKLNGLIQTDIEVVEIGKGDPVVEEEAPLGNLDQIILQNDETLLSKIYSVLGGKFWDRINQAKEGLTPNQVAPQNFDPEKVLKLEILKQNLLTEEQAEEKLELIQGIEAKKKDKNDNELKNPTITNILDYIVSLAAIPYYRMGGQDYPMEVPENLTQTPSKETDVKKISLPHSARFQKWFFERFDEISGQYPLAIDIEDSDLVKAGEQLVQLRYPNISEALTELLGKQIEMNGKVEASLSAILKNLSETGSSKIAAIKCCYQVDAVLTWLAFKTKEVAIEVPFSYTVPHSDEEINAEGIPGDVKKRLEEEKANFEKYWISTFLQNSMQRITVEELDEPNQNFGTYLTEFSQVAAICRTALTQSGPANNKKEFLQNLYRSIAENLKNSSSEKTSKIGDFSDYIDNIEDGFISAAGNADVTKPYGKDYGQRPKIKEIYPPEKPKDSTS